MSASTTRTTSRTRRIRTSTKFWYNTGRGAWYILEQKNAPESGDIYEDDTHYWSIVEEKSIAQDVLKVVLAYAG